MLNNFIISSSIGTVDYQVSNNNTIIHYVDSSIKLSNPSYYDGISNAFVTLNSNGQMVQQENKKAQNAYYSKEIFNYDNFGGITSINTFIEDTATIENSKIIFTRDSKVVTKLNDFYDKIFGDLKWFYKPKMEVFNQSIFYNQSFQDINFSKTLPLKIQGVDKYSTYYFHSQYGITTYYNYANTYDIDGNVIKIVETDDANRVTSKVYITYN